MGPFEQQVEAASSGGRLSIKSGTYRDKPGFMVSGKDPKGRSIRIFAKTREGAEKIRAAKLSGDNWEEVDRILRSGG